MGIEKRDSEKRTGVPCNETAMHHASKKSVRITMRRDASIITSLDIVAEPDKGSAAEGVLGHHGLTCSMAETRVQKLEEKCMCQYMCLIKYIVEKLRKSSC